MYLDINKNTISSFIDHTLLKADSRKEEIIKLCSEASEFHFYSVCVNPTYVSLAKSLLKETSVKVCSVVGFPLGANFSKIKSKEAIMAVSEGADEVDMVLNISALKNGEYSQIEDEISLVVDSVPSAIVKVIIETCLLSDEEKVKSCELIQKSKAHFVKTSTGFSHNGAILEDIVLLKKIVKDNLKIKASGGIRTFSFAKDLILSGADRIGCGQSISLIK